MLAEIKFNLETWKGCKETQNAVAQLESAFEAVKKKIHIIEVESLCWGQT